MRNGFSGMLVLVGALLAVVAGVGGFYYLQQQNKLASINSFEECSKYYPIMESFPAQCNTPDGKHFVQELGEEEQKKLVPPGY